jgi:hypothetical protein
MGVPLARSSRPAAGTLQMNTYEITISESTIKTAVARVKHQSHVVKATVVRIAV